MQAWLSKILVCAIAIAFTAAPSGVVPLGDDANAMPSNSKPKVKRKCIKYKPRKGKKRCVKWRKAGLTDQQIYYIGYTLAHQGDYELALEYLSLANNKDDPKINSYIGFAKRKLGDVDGALQYYRKTLAVAPNDTRARSYMGEAFLQQGDAVKAKEQLAEIEARCGRNCKEYGVLAEAIAKFEARKT